MELIVVHKISYPAVFGPEGSFARSQLGLPDLEKVLLMEGFELRVFTNSLDVL